MRKLILTVFFALAACEMPDDVDWLWINDPMLVEEMAKLGFTHDPATDVMSLNGVPVYKFDRSYCGRGCMTDRTQWLGPRGTSLENTVIAEFLEAKAAAIAARDSRFLDMIGVEPHDTPDTDTAAAPAD